MSLLLDTHAALWLLQGDERLGRGVTREIRRNSLGQVFMSDISLLEISMLLSRGRVVVNGDQRSFLRNVAAKLHILPIDPDVAATATEATLPHGDPFDRVIVATALHHGLSLATRDGNITRSKLVRTVWK